MEIGNGDVTVEERVFFIVFRKLYFHIFVFYLDDLIENMSNVCDYLLVVGGLV